MDQFLLFSYWIKQIGGKGISLRELDFKLYLKKKHDVLIRQKTRRCSNL